MCNHLCGAESKRKVTQQSPQQLTTETVLLNSGLAPCKYSLLHTENLEDGKHNFAFISEAFRKEQGYLKWRGVISVRYCPPVDLFCLTEEWGWGADSLKSTEGGGGGAGHSSPINASSHKKEIENISEGKTHGLVSRSNAELLFPHKGELCSR